MSYLDRVMGARNEHIQPVLAKIKGSSLEDLLGQAGTDFDGHIGGRLQQIYPQKYETVGEDSIRKLTEHATVIAKSRGMTSGRGRGALVLMMFILGSGFYHDPLYPWAPPILGDMQIPDEGEKTDLLVGTAKKHLDKWLK
jgi:hypothetical protein